MAAEVRLSYKFFLSNKEIERIMERIRQVQEYVDGVISKLPEEIDKKYGYMHLYGVSQACALLAMKRKPSFS